ncbi:hypothetical protein [Candidatus Nitrotoga fabula]|uniref:hypothetical protein n=1 Tax=Candidatus Nitrotoga fabula TaxID=2182327 RepID=UPI001BB4715C|nr:hypothetical protein [Candidatus Nitrotoga fabula]
MNRKSPPTDTPNGHPSCLSTGDPVIQVRASNQGDRPTPWIAVPGFLPGLRLSTFRWRNSAG